MVRVSGARLIPMDARDIVEGLALTARAAARTLVATTGEQRRQALLAIADEIDARTDEIIAALASLPLSSTARRATGGPLTFRPTLLTQEIATSYDLGGGAVVMAGYGSDTAAAAGNQSQYSIGLGLSF